MKCKFIETTATSAEPLLGKDVNLSLGLNAYFSFEAVDVPFEFRHGEYRTSMLSNVNFEEVSQFCYRITVDTQNNRYVFQYGELSDKPPFSKREKLELAIAMGMDIIN